MAKYIDKDALIKTTEETPFTMSMFLNRDQCEGANMARHTFAEIFKILPAADVVEVRHGRWLPDYDYTEYDFDGSTPLSEPRKFQDGWQCSLCGQYEPSETNYCPNCGAKMDGGADDAAD